MIVRPRRRPPVAIELKAAAGLRQVPSSRPIVESAGLFEFVLCDRISIWMHKANSAICTGGRRGGGGPFLLAQGTFERCVYSRPLPLHLLLAQPSSFFFLAHLNQRVHFRGLLEGDVSPRAKRSS